MATANLKIIFFFVSISDGTFDEEKNEDKLQKEIDTIEYIDK